ncbi:hypothetical protein [Streptomyces sp. NBC_00078]|uniref:hypothetical protein n=1 Tax=unclassified Streptomyces TaxID=2593676 RepID=UPI0022549AB4|nr:hypothetical protein [Streptomyces sp. NBC_00078]MCX5421035.1 hypothetical protein [Streptomyces sp. NBC_00078]
MAARDATMAMTASAARSSAASPDEGRAVAIASIWPPMPGGPAERVAVGAGEAWTGWVLNANQPVAPLPRGHRLIFQGE